MKTQINLIFRSFVLFGIIMAVGCKQAEEKSPTSQDPAVEIDYDSLQEEVADSVLTNNGAVIQMEIKDADALFNSNEPSLIEEGNSDLNYIGLKSMGRPGDDASTNATINAKQLISSVYIGKQTVWMISPRSQGDYMFGIQEVDFAQGDKPTDNGTEACSAFTIKRALPESSGAVKTQVKQDESLIGCKQPYSVIFYVENKKSKKTRYFVLDPWVLVK